MKPFPGEKLQRVPPLWRYELTDEQKQWLAEVFPIAKNARVAKAMGVSDTTMHRFARDMGLKKDGAFMKLLYKHVSKAAKRTCQANGYYEKLRAEGIPQKCRDGFRRYVEEGRFKSPIHIIRETDPKRYRKLKRDKSKRRKALIQDERKRIRLGLSRRTNLHLPVNNWTTRDINHRANCFKAGYIIPDRTDIENRWVVWYDDDTERKPRMERNMIKDGFTFMKLEEDEA